MNSRDELVLYGQSRQRIRFSEEMVASPLMDDVLVLVAMPDLGLTRKLGRWLCLDAKAAAEQGDSERAMADLLAISGLANQTYRKGFVIDQLVAFSLDALLMAALDDLIKNHQQLFNEQELKTLQKALAVAAKRSWLNVEHEAYIMLDVLQRMYSRDDWMTNEGLEFMQEFSQMSFRSYEENESFSEHLHRLATYPLMGGLMPSHPSMVERLERWIAAIQAESTKPYRLNPSETSLPDNPVIAELDRLRYGFLDRSMASTDAARRAAERTQAKLLARALGIEIELHRNRVGRYAADPSELDVDAEPFIFSDPIDGEPIRYRLIEGRPVIYSVGADRDDDGGRPAEGGEFAAAEWYPLDEPVPADVPDGDWVLWPATYDE